MNKPWWDVPSVTTFRAVAQRFTDLLNARDQHTSVELLHAVHPMLAELYLAGLALPIKPEEAFGDDDEEYELPAVDQAAIERHHTKWNSLHQSLAKKLGPKWNFYQEVFDPYGEPNEEPVTGSLADDLADIYLDLLKGEKLWAEEERDEAVWEWRFGFESHWGEHVTGALRAVRTLSASHDLGFPESSPVDV